jgi:hypothetical protein
MLENEIVPIAFIAGSVALVSWMLYNSRPEARKKRNQEAHDRLMTDISSELEHVRGGRNRRRTKRNRTYNRNNRLNYKVKI